MKSKNYKSNHALDILTKLNNERKSMKHFCDVTLTAGSNSFAGHKCILRVFSTVFQKMFAANMREKFENKADMKGVSEGTLETVLDFIYTCNVTITNENVYVLIEASNYMDIPQLKGFCLEFLLESIDASNAIGIRAYSKSYDKLTENLDKITEKADQFIAENFETVVESEDFLQTPFKEVKEILQLDEKEVSSEEVVYHAMMRWIKYDVHAREKHVTSLLACIQLFNLSLDFLRNIVIGEKLIIHYPECTNMCLQSFLNRNVTEKNFTGKAKILKPEKHFIAIFKQQVFSYSVSKKEASTLPSPMSAHQNGSAVHHNRKVFLISGHGTNAVEEFDLDNPTRSWRKRTQTNIQRKGSSSAIYNDCIFVCGGDISSQSSDCYDILDGRWTKTINMTEGRTNFALVSHTCGLYAIGGMTSRNSSHAFTNIQAFPFLNTIEHLEPNKSVWKQLPPMSVERCALAAVVLREEIYAIGGRNNQGRNTHSVEKFDLLSNTWSNVANLNVARGGHGACVLDGKIDVAGGGSQAVEVYDPKRNVWEVHANVHSLQNVQFIVAV